MKDLRGFLLSVSPLELLNSIDYEEKKSNCHSYNSSYGENPCVKNFPGHHTKSQTRLNRSAPLIRKPGNRKLKIENSTNMAAEVGNFKIWRERFMVLDLYICIIV